MKRLVLAVLISFVFAGLVTGCVGVEQSTIQQATKAAQSQQTGVSTVTP